MELKYATKGQLANRGLDTLDTPPRRNGNGLRCSMPFAVPALCGGLGQRADLPPNSVVIPGNSPNPDLWFVRTGILRLQRYGPDGRRQILSLFLPGEFIGQIQFREGTSVETCTQSDLCRIDRRSFDTMLNKDDALRTDLARQQQDHHDRLHWLTLSLGLLGPEERLCAFLALSSAFMPYHRLADGTGILSMLLPRKDIADLLAVPVELIGRLLRKLAEASVVEIKDPVHFRIIDLKKLISLGRFDTHFDRLTSGIVARRDRLHGLMALPAENTVCICG